MKVYQLMSILESLPAGTEVFVNSGNYRGLLSSNIINVNCEEPEHFIYIEIDPEFDAD